MHFNGLKFSGALEQFSFTLGFLGSKMQKLNVLKKIRVFGASLVIEVQAVTNQSANLKLQTFLKFC